MSETQSKKNVYQRLQEVASVVGNLQGTSKDRFGSKAIGIEDVENAIRDELTKHGLVTRWYAWSGTRWEFVPVGSADEQQMRDAAAWLLAAKWPMHWQQRAEGPDTFRLCVICERPLCYFHYTGLRYVAGYSNPPRPCWLCPDCGARTYGDPVQERAA